MLAGRDTRYVMSNTFLFNSSPVCCVTNGNLALFTTQSCTRELKIARSCVQMHSWLESSFLSELELHFATEPSGYALDRCHLSPSPPQLLSFLVFLQKVSANENFMQGFRRNKNTTEIVSRTRTAGRPVSTVWHRDDVVQQPPSLLLSLV